MAPIYFAHFLSRLFFFNVEVAIVIIEVAIGQTKFGGHTVFSEKNGCLIKNQEMVEGGE